MMLKERLLSTDESAKEPVIQLMGESGLGKTTLIFRLCNDSDVREKFSKHVAYLNLAELEKSKEDVQDKAIEKFYQQLAEKLTGAKFAKSSRAQCISQFDALCDKHREKPLLIALDNVVHKSTYTESFPFRRLPPGSVVLISSSGPLRRTSRGDTEIKAWEKGALRLGPWTIGERAALLAWHLLERPIEQLGEGERQRVTALGKACSDGNPSSLVVRAPGLKQRLEAAAASKDGGLDAAWESIIEEWTDSEDLFLDTGLSKVEAAYKVLYDGLHEAEQIMLVDLLLFGRNMGSPLVGPVPVPKDAALQMWGVSESRGLSWGLQRANVRLEKLISLGLVACERRPYVSALHGQEAVGDILTIQASLQSLLQRVVVEGVALEEQHQLLGILPELPTQLPQVLPKARKFFGPNAGFRGPSYASKLLSKMDGLQCLSLAFTYSYLSEEGVPSLPFPPPFGHLGRLLHLNLSGCRIGEVPRDVFSLPCLRALVLQNCTVDAPGCFPEEVGGLGSLEVLDLSFSQGLVRLPGALAGLKQLDTLIVRGCCDLKHIPDLRDNVKRVDARGCTSLREFPENNLSLLVPAKVGAWRVQRVTWLRWEYETDEGDEFKEETGDAAAYADRRGWSFCVEKLRAMLQRGYEYSAKFGRGAFGTAGSLFRWPSDNERRAFEAVLDVLCSARHDPDAEGESVLTDAAREGALDALGRVAASSWLNLELRAKALKALERQVSADAGQALSYSIAHRPREIESKEGKSFGEGNWRGSEEESDTGESDDERGGSSEDDSEGSEEGSEDPPEETGEMKAKAELLPHLLRLWAEERRRKSKSPGRHMLLDSVWKVVSAMRSACAAGSSRNGGVRWRVLWLSAVLAIQVRTRRLLDLCLSLEATGLKGTPLVNTRSGVMFIPR